MTEKKRKPRKPTSPYLTTEEAAKFLRVRIRTMRNWRWKGIGPAFRRHGRRVVYIKADLLAYSRDKAKRETKKNG